MSVTLLPETAYPREELTWGIVGRGGLLRPLSGGKTQFQGRVGDMTAIGGQLPLMDKACADEWIAAMSLQRLGNPVRWTLPPMYRLSGAGAPRVNGGGQQGSSLVTDGWTPGMVIPVNTPFNVPNAAGRPFLHRTSATVTANGSGQVTLPFTPMLRIIPADNALIEVAAPKIEGWLNDAGVNWTVTRLRFHRLPFGIAEDQ